MEYLTVEPIRLDELVEAVRAPDRGGIAAFLGVVRDHHEGRRVVRLAYSAYREMAQTECARIVAEAEARWPCRVALRHRVGALEIGELAVGVAAAAGHRGEAFAACRYVIEALKHRVPIWKREVYANGREAWVDPTAAGGAIPAKEAPPE